jgi:hypothetical protein
MADALPYKDDESNAVSTWSKRYAGLMMGDFGESRKMGQAWLGFL